MPNILSLDQSSKVTGWAIFNNSTLIKYGKFTCKSADLGMRLKQIRDFIKQLIEENQINKVYIEDIQLQDNVANNVVTFKTLAEVMGVLIELFEELNIEYESCFPTSWKKGIRLQGTTRAVQKKNAQNYVATVYNIVASEDESDAICLGTYMITRNAPIAKEDGFDWSN